MWLAVDVCCCAVTKAGEAAIVALAKALEAGGCPSLQHLEIYRKCRLLVLCRLLLHSYVCTGVHQADRRVLLVLTVSTRVPTAGQSAGSALAVDGTLQATNKQTGN